MLPKFRIFIGVAKVTEASQIQHQSPSMLDKKQKGATRLQDSQSTSTEIVNKDGKPSCIEPQVGYTKYS